MAPDLLSVSGAHLLIGRNISRDNSMAKRNLFHSILLVMAVGAFHGQTAQARTGAIDGSIVLPTNQPTERHEILLLSKTATVMHTPIMICPAGITSRTSPRGPIHLREDRGI